MLQDYCAVYSTCVVWLQGQAGVAGPRGPPGLDGCNGTQVTVVYIVCVHVTCMRLFQSHLVKLFFSFYRRFCVIY